MIDSTTKQQALERANWLFNNVLHASMATVNKDGSPHNTPYLFIKNSDATRLYWGSHPKSVHSKNIEATRQIYVVLYDAFERGGLYIQASGARVAEGDELNEALDCHNDRRKELKRRQLEKGYYTDDSPQRMYLAEIDKMWINYEDRDTKGLMLRDCREEITKEELLGAKQ